MPKKQPKNSFYFFMRHEYEIFRENGIVFKNGFKDPELARMASEKWKPLSANEKKIYEDMAKTAKEEEKGQGNFGRLDCLGNLISERENLEEEPLKRRKIQCSNLREQFQRLREKSVVAQEKFYLIQFEIFCETEEGEILPCEVGVVEYSLADGITYEYHAFIDPGPIPIGYSYTCMNNSELTHKIPIRDFDLASTDYFEIHNAIRNMVDPDRNKRCPIVYATYNNIAVIEKCLDWLSQGAEDFHTKWEIYEAEVLFQELQNFVNISLPRGIVITKLSSAVYDYQPNTRCPWHEENEIKDCALGHVKRICFQISEHTCLSYDCILTKSHLPERCEVPQIPALANSGASFNFRPIKNRVPEPSPISFPSSNLSRYQMLMKTGFSQIGDDFNTFENDAVPEIMEEKPVLKPLRMPSTKGITETLGSKSHRDSSTSLKQTAAVGPRPSFTSVLSGNQAPTMQQFGNIRLRSLLPQPVPNVQSMNRGTCPPPIAMPTPASLRFPGMPMTRFTHCMNQAAPNVSPRMQFCGRGTTIDKNLSDAKNISLGRGLGLLDKNILSMDKLKLQDG